MAVGIQIPNLPAAIALGGLEMIEAVQAGVSVRVTPLQIAQFFNGNPPNAAGSNTQIQFNNLGSMGASANLTWNGTQLYTTQAAITNLISTSAQITNLGLGMAPNSRQLAMTGDMQLAISGSSTQGVIYKYGTTYSAQGTSSVTDSRPWLHDYRPLLPFPSDGVNVFLGSFAGNFTMAPDAGAIGTYSMQCAHNVGVGAQSMLRLTTGYNNTAVGTNSMRETTQGFSNAAFGRSSLQSNTIGTYNSAFGQSAFISSLSGSRNSAFGALAGQSLTTGEDNTFLGYNAGSNIETGRANTIIGANNLNFSAGSSNLIRISDGDGNVRFASDSSGNVGLGTNSPLTALNVYGSNDSVATMTGYIVGNVLTVTALSSGAIAVGNVIGYTGIEVNTYVTSFGTGTGGLGTYNLSNSMTYASSGTPASMFAFPGNACRIRITNSDQFVQIGQTIGSLEFWSEDVSIPGAGVKGYISVVAESSTPDAAMVFGIADNVANYQAVEAMRISSTKAVSLLGALSVAGAITFSTPLSVTSGGTGTGTEFTAGSVIFAGASGVYSQDNTKLFWDNTNDRLGIGTASPTKALSVTTDALVSGLTIGKGTSSVATNSAFGVDAMLSVGAGARGSAFGYNALRLMSTGNDNSAFGHTAMAETTTGYYNSAFGAGGLTANVDGYANSAFGYRALYSNTGGLNPDALPGGQQQSAFGYRALYSCTTGYQNQAFGVQAMFNLTTGRNNTAVGMYALLELLTTDYNVAVGFNSGRNLTTGSNNVSVGKGSINESRLGVENVAVGYHSMYGASDVGLTNQYNSAFGAHSMTNFRDGEYNVAVGFRTMELAVTATGQIGIGFRALRSVSGTGYNIAIGHNSSFSMTTGVDNIAIGRESSYTMTTATNNISIGPSSNYYRTGNNNVAIGSEALRGSIGATGGDNVAIGVSANLALTTGTGNVSVGFEASHDNTTGIDNVSIGPNAAHAVDTYSYNISIGGRSNRYRQASNNVAIGIDALRGSAGSTTGGNNVAIGHQSGISLTTGTGNTFLGYLTAQNFTTGSKNTVLGSNPNSGITTGGSNTIVGANVTGLSSSLANNVVIADGDGNQRIKADSNGLVTIPGSFGRGAPVEKTADFSVATTENWLINNKSGSACSVTLPSAATYVGREIMISNWQAQAVNSASSNVIPQAGGAAGTAILAATAGKWATLVSNGTNWIIMQSGG